MTSKKDSKQHGFDYMVGGWPANVDFLSKAYELREIVGKVDPADLTMSSTVAEICLIALVAFFQSFCKNTFASLINIYHPVVLNLANKRGSILIDVRDILAIQDSTKYQFGLLVSERYSFSSPKETNTLFYDLLGFSPFRKSDIEKLNTALHKRNLMVHSGGFNLRTPSSIPLNPKQLMRNRVWVTNGEFLDLVEFAERLCKKLSVESCNALEKLLKQRKIRLNPAQKEALKFIGHIAAVTK